MADNVTVEVELEFVVRAGLRREAEREVMHVLVVNGLLVARRVGQGVRVGVIEKRHEGVGHRACVRSEEPEPVAHDRPADAGVDRPEILDPVDRGYYFPSGVSNSRSPASICPWFTLLA